jgi:hypothetical protein
LFNVSDENMGQSLKTGAAKRIVPIHSELVRCGFLDYAKALPGDGQLFPALKPGGPDGKYNHYFAKRFTEYRRKCGVTAPRTAFHSFRKNVAQALKNKRATAAEIAELIGHEQGFTFSIYAPMQLPMKALKELIERVRLPWIALKPFVCALDQRKCSGCKRASFAPAAVERQHCERQTRAVTVRISSPRCGVAVRFSVIGAIVRRRRF